MGAAIWSTDPARMLGVPGALLRALPAQPRHADGRRPAALARDPRRLGALRRAAGRAVSRPHPAEHAGGSACAAPDGVLVQARGARSRALRPRLHRLPLPTRHCACWPMPAAREREILGALPYQRNEARAAHRHLAAAAARRPGRPGTTTSAASATAVALTYDMNMLQGLHSRHTFCVTLNRTATIDPRARSASASTTSIRCSRPRAWRRSSGSTRSAASRARTYCGAYWRYGFHEDGVVSALAARASTSSEDRDAQRAVHAGGLSTGALRRGRMRSATALFMAVPRPGGAGRGVPRPLAVVHAAAGAGGFDRARPPRRSGAAAR